MFQFYFPTVVALSFGPALALIYFSLASYTYPRSDRVYFDDRWIFGLFSIGIVLGSLFYYTELRIVGVAGGFLSLSLFLIIQELIVLVILNFPHMRRKGNSRYYGFSLGLSLASGLSLGAYGIELGGTAGINAGVLLILFLYTISAQLMGCSTGSIIGLSIELSRIPLGIVSSILLQILYNFIVFPVLLFRPSLLTFSFDAGGLALSLLLYFYTIKRILPQRPEGTVRRRFI